MVRRWVAEASLIKFSRWATQAVNQRNINYSIYVNFFPVDPKACPYTSQGNTCNHLVLAYMNISIYLLPVVTDY